MKQCSTKWHYSKTCNTCFISYYFTNWIVTHPAPVESSPVAPTAFRIKFKLFILVYEFLRIWTLPAPLLTAPTLICRHRRHSRSSSAAVPHTPYMRSCLFCLYSSHFMCLGCFASLILLAKCASLSRFKCHLLQGAHPWHPSPWDAHPSCLCRTLGYDTALVHLLTYLPTFPRGT